MNANALVYRPCQVGEFLDTLSKEGFDHLPMPEVSARENQASLMQELKTVIEKRKQKMEAAVVVSPVHAV